MSERFIPKNFPGLPFLTDGYRVAYEEKGKPYHLFLVENRSEDAARTVFRKFVAFLSSQYENVSHYRRTDYVIAFALRNLLLAFPAESISGSLLTNAP